MFSGYSVSLFGQKNKLIAVLFYYFGLGFLSFQEEKKLFSHAN